jgi:uncharacterized protein (DUF1800 family)
MQRGARGRSRGRGTDEAARLRAGHVLRRLGFGPSPRDMRRVLRIGIDAWIEEQLHPESITDFAAEARFRRSPKQFDLPLSWLYRWYTRMVHSRRQLQEKMTLFWHAHFATSVGKIGYFTLVHDQEQFLRDNALGSFRDLLIGVTRDNAMLLYLDNSGNDGQAVSDGGELVPPNENYARELLQLFAIGVDRLAMDGTPLLESGAPIPAFGERDVKEVARALTGWAYSTNANFLGEPQDRPNPPARFIPEAHDPGAKVVLGEVIPAAPGEAGAMDVERVVDILMRQPTMAPFISKLLIQKLVTETPDPAYVERVATVFAFTDGDIAATLRAIVGDPEFFSDEVMLTQYRDPVEQFVGALRALGGRSSGVALHEWCSKSAQSLWFPPSVFSFYRPGQKRSLVEAGLISQRDQAALALASAAVDSPSGTGWDARRFIRRHDLAQHPERAVDALAAALLAAPLRPEVRDEIAAYIGAEVDEDKIRGAAWLIMTSPEFQVY